MSRVPRILVAAAVVALMVTAAGYASSAAPKQRSSSAAADRTALMLAHRGGTLKLLAKSAGGTLDPQVNYTLQYWQLYQATYDGLLAFKKAGGNAAFTVVPDLARDHPDTDERRQDVGLQASARGSSSRTASR